MKSLLALSVGLFAVSTVTGADYTDVVRYGQECRTDAMGRVTCVKVVRTESTAASVASADAAPCPCVAATGSCSCTASASVASVATTSARPAFFPVAKSFFASIRENRQQRVAARRAALFGAYWK